MLMIYDNPDAPWTGTDAQRRELGEMFALRDALIASGELISSEALQQPEQVATVRVRGGVPDVTDGPFAETKEQLAGYLLVECASRERAVRIAAQLPPARGYAVEVWPVIPDDELRREAAPPPSGAA
ncbi:YciI family protein [Haloactinopolyspora alba]|nr:YciI family protein [Haloactinopolyspora alba]